MGKKKNNGGGCGGENEKEDAILAVVLKLDMHCEGCATKIKKSVRSFQGVEVVKGGDGELTKLTVIGKVDPLKLREAVEKKVKKKVELVSPAPPKKDNNNANNNNNKKKENENCNSNKEQSNGGGGGEKKCGGGGEKKGGAGGGEKKGEDNKKPKELPVMMAVMKLNLHCQGCIKKIRKRVTKTKGFLDISIDEGKDQITVKGAMDMKALAQSLAAKLKKPVEIVPPKEAEKKGKEKDKNNGGNGKAKAGGGENGSCGGGENLIYDVQYGYPNPAVFGYWYGYGYPVGQLHASQMFSDENPNACSVM